MVLIFIDVADGHVKKASLEALSYGAQLATQLGTKSAGVVINYEEQLADLGIYGIDTVYKIAAPNLSGFDAQVYAQAIGEAATKTSSSVIVLSNNSSGKAIAPRLSAKLKAGLVAGAIALPDTSNGFVVKKNVFSGKAFAQVKINTDVKVISVSPNAFSIIKTEGKQATIETLDIAIETPKVKVTATNKITGEVPLAEAELVISGGRGLKGPENWHLVTDLAKLVGAATACSRAVADAHWRPHHEHVGQTGGAVAPNLYFAIGISGAIQHLAGVNRSKVIVVINKDPEAPFFKAADYGIVGDAFEVMPKIIDAVKKLKG